MIKVGLTGNIGSGKTFVADLFKTLSIPVYNSDIEAKKFLFTLELKNKLISSLGDKIISNNEIDTKKLANSVFGNVEELNFLNSLIHPLVSEDIIKWCENYKRLNYVIIETAILFESGFEKFVDKTIIVTAPVETRIERVIKRDKCGIDEVKKRMISQWDELLKIKLADFKIINDGQKEVMPQVQEIHEYLLKSSE